MWDQLDLRLPSNVWLRGLFLWATILVPGFAVVLIFAVGAGFGNPDLSGNPIVAIFNAIAETLMALVLIIVLVTLIWVSLVIVWAWGAPRLAMRYEFWNRWQRLGGGALINLLGGILLGVIAALAEFAEGGRPSELVRTVTVASTWVGVPSAALGAISGFTSKRLAVPRVEEESETTEPTAELERSRPPRAKPARRAKARAPRRP